MPLGTLGVKQFSEAGAVSNIKTPFTLTLEACGPHLCWRENPLQRYAG